MDARATWWRRVFGVLVAVAFAMMMLAPAAQAADCPDEAKVATASADQLAVTVSSSDAPVDQPCDDGCCPCVCCHAHHAGAFGLTAGVGLAAPSEQAARHVLAEAPVPTSKPTFGLKRPPRA